MKVIPYGRQEISEEDIQTVVSVLKSEFLTQGPAVLEFEKKFADYVGAKYAVAVSNGTAALHLGALALGVKEGDKVLTTPITFAASSNCVLYCGGNVEFVDIDPENYCIDIKKLEETLNSHPSGTYKGIIPVHFAGFPIDMERLNLLAKKYGIWIMEDASHAPGASFKDSKGNWHKIGDCSFSDLTTFSFHPVKHIACGEGGMVTTNNYELYQKLLLLRTHGITKNADLMKNSPHGDWYYEMQDLGFNYRISDILCALGSSQLSRAESNLMKRQKIADKYDRELSGLPLQIPIRNSSISHAFHLYVILVEKRKELYQFLKSKNIYCQVHYIPVPKLPYYSEAGFTSADIPKANWYYERCLSLPMYHSLSDEQQSYVIQSIREFFNA